MSGRTDDRLTLDPDRDPWERQRGERAEHYRQFGEYLGQPGRRSLRKAAETLQVHAVTVRRTAARNRWTQRAAAWDANELADRMADVRAARLRNLEDDGRMLRALRGKLVQRLQSLDPATMSAADTIRLAEVLFRAGRTLYGDPAEILGISGPRGDDPIAAELAEFAQLNGEAKARRLRELREEAERRAFALTGEDDE